MGCKKGKGKKGLRKMDLGGTLNPNYQEPVVQQNNPVKGVPIIGGIVGAANAGSGMMYGLQTKDEFGHTTDTKANEAFGAFGSALNPIGGYARIQRDSNMDQSEKNKAIAMSIINPFKGGVDYVKRQGKEAEEYKMNQKKAEAMNTTLANMQNYNMNIPTYRDGGEIQNPELDMISGNTHEQGGTNIANMAEAEKGETKLDKFIFSDTLEITKKMAKDYGLADKYVGKTFADASKSIDSRFKLRENDKYDSKEKERQLNQIRNVQEAEKAIKKQKDVGRLLNKYPDIAQMLQQGTGQQAPQVPQMQQQGQGLPMMRTGGDIPPYNPQYDFAGNPINTYRDMKGSDLGSASLNLQSKEIPLNFNTSSNSYNNLPEVNVKAKQLNSADNNLDIPIRTGVSSMNPLTSDKVVSDLKSTTSGTTPGVIPKGQGEDGSYNSKMNTSELFMSNLGNIYDIARGIHGMLKPEKRMQMLERQIVSPALLDATRAIQDVGTVYGGATDAVRQNSQGQGNYLSNRLALAQQEDRAKQGVNAQYDAANVGITNQTRQVNAGAALQADSINIQQKNLEEQINQQEKDIASNMVQGGLSNFAEIYMSAKKDRAAADMQNNIVNMIGTNNYTYRYNPQTRMYDIEFVASDGLRQHRSVSEDELTTGGNGTRRTRRTTTTTTN